MNAPLRQGEFQWGITDLEVRAEAGVLGIALCVPRLFPKIAERLDVTDFGEPIHASIFEAMLQVSQRGLETSVTNVLAICGEALREHPIIKANGTDPGFKVREYIVKLINAFGAPLALPGYIKLVKDGANRRMQALAIWDAREALEGGAPFADVAHLVAKAMEPREKETRGYLSLSDAAQASLDAAEAVWRGDAQPMVPYGIAPLDNLTGGAAPGNLVVIAGRPGMGKSAFGLHVALTAGKAGQAGVVCTLEMTPEQMSSRLMSAWCFDGPHRIAYSQMGKKGMSEAQLKALFDAQRSLAELPVAFDPCGGQTVQVIAGKIRAAKARFEQSGHEMRFAIVDHIHLIAGDRSYKGQKVHEISDITATLKALANELGIAIFALSQLNRSLENRDDKRPTLADLRESGSIEQDADCVIGLYREEYYLGRKTDLTPEEAQALARLRNIIEIEILKQRNGPTDRVLARCFIDHNVFAGLG